MVVAAPSAPALTFDSLLHQAVVARGSRERALSLGLTEQALARYAAGACSVYERARIESLLPQSSWALSHITEIVKARRRKKEAA